MTSSLGSAAVRDGWSRRVASAVADGTWVTAVPFPSVLSYSHSYAVRVDAGVVVVDLGWDSDDAWDAFQLGLARAGTKLEEVIGVVVTHVHPDHYGLAGRIRASTDAWIAAHPAERAQVAGTSAERVARVHEMLLWLEVCGVPETELEQLRGEVDAVAATLPTEQPNHDLLDGDPVPDTDGRLVAVHTPGHTPGHLCFVDRSRNTVFTGDHLLPRITPNVSKRPGSLPDPLHEYVDSLRRLTKVASAPLVLPGHEWSFDRLEDRVAALETHHEERMREVAEAVRLGARTVWESALAVRWSRPFETLDPRARRQAIGETHAHLVRLAARGDVVLQTGPVHQWRSRPGA